MKGKVDITMKKILFLICLSVLFSRSIHTQSSQFHLSGHVEVEYKNYDINTIFIQKNEYAELLLVISKNGKEILQEGPSKNSNTQYFSMDKFILEPTDTLQINCWDMDKNNIFTMGLNGDDFICTFTVPAVDLLSNSAYSFKLPYSANTITIYTQKYYPATIAVHSFTADSEIATSDFKKTKKGLICQLKSDGQYNSSLAKGKKGKFNWADTGTCYVYDGMEVAFSIRTFTDEEWTKLIIPVKEGKQSIRNAAGVFEVEIIPH